jgi:hypothetical protein
MALRIQPLPSSDNLSSYASPLIAQLNTDEIIQSSSNPAPYTLWLMRKVCSGAARHDAAIAAQRWILHETGNVSLGPLFAALATLDVLGRVNTTTMTEPMLALFITTAQSLHNVVFLAKAKLPAQLLDATKARQIQITSKFGSPAAPFLPFLNRVATALLPYIPQP